ncbi:hypothetical protein KGV55_01570, partial [Candidatus Gracilibacteria bacterium]|nr:hypothetical protein [Candidatus Gracilibacteria bacterium]
NEKTFQIFNEAFAYYRKVLGVNHIFEWHGKKFNTNFRNEPFRPSQEVQCKYGLGICKNINQKSIVSGEVYSREEDFQYFGQAFRYWRKKLGANKVFKWHGKKYRTNVISEPWNPTRENIQPVKDIIFKNKEEIVEKTPEKAIKNTSANNENISKTKTKKSEEKEVIKETKKDYNPFEDFGETETNSCFDYKTKETCEPDGQGLHENGCMWVNEYCALVS